MSRWDVAPVVRISCGLAALVSLSTLIAGCGKDNFARINGQTISVEDYVKALEREQVALPGGQPPTNAERAVLDQLVTNQIIMADALKEQVVPTDKQVDDFYGLQSDLFQQQMPTGKDFASVMRDQGMSPEDIKANLKIQLSETRLYAKRLSLTDSDVRKIYDNAHGKIGLPARFLLRLIVVAPNGPDFARAKQQLASGADFNTVAKTINANPSLRASGGLLQQYTRINDISPKYQQTVLNSKVGSVIGPIDFQIAQNQPPVKAWIKIEDKRLPYDVPYEEAEPMILQELVQAKISRPENASIRNQIIQEKLQAAFEPSNPAYAKVWDAIKTSATQAGIGQPAAGSAGAGSNPMGGTLGGTSPTK